MYNGSLYYYCHDIESIIKYELTTRQTTRLQIPRNRITQQWQGKLADKLYSAQQPNKLEFNKF